VDDCELVATEAAVTTTTSTTAGGGADDARNESAPAGLPAPAPSVKEELKMTADAESNTVNSG